MTTTAGMTPREMMQEAGIPLPPHVELIGGNVHVTEWAMCVGVTPNALGKRVRRRTGRSACNYVRFARVLAALPDICAKMPLRKVAARHGYSRTGFDLSNLCVQVFGMRPTEMHGMDWREVARIGWYRKKTAKVA